MTIGTKSFLQEAKYIWEVGTTILASTSQASSRHLFSGANLYFAAYTSPDARHLAASLQISTQIHPLWHNDKPSSSNFDASVRTVFVLTLSYNVTRRAIQKFTQRVSHNLPVHPAITTINHSTRLILVMYLNCFYNEPRGAAGKTE